jgi:hypothetical protein
VHLDVVGRNGDERIRAIGLPCSEIHKPAGLIGAEGRRDVPGRRQRRLGVQQHVGAHVLDRLETADRTPELEPGLGVIGGHPHRVQRAAGLLAQ